jgi:hypothetical protein
MKISIRYVVVQTATGAMVNVRHSLHQAIEDCENMDKCYISREIKFEVDEVLTVTSVSSIHIDGIKYIDLHNLNKAELVQLCYRTKIDIKA